MPWTIRQTVHAEARASLGLGALGHSVVIAQRLDDASLQRVLAFDARDRTTAFTKELRDAPAMQREVPGEVAAARRADLAASQQQYDEGLRVAASSLASIADTQRRHFQQKEGQPTGEDDGAEDELAVPPPPREPAVAPPEQPAAYFVPSDRWRRPSDFLAHQVELFEAGETVPPGTPKEPKQVTRDQLLFLAQFAAALNQVWQDEQADTPMRQREQFSFLLMGQGGSGKTAIVQQVVLPTMDFVFPPDDNDVKSSLIVCSSWAQAENISTEEHRAVSCHNAAAMRVQSLRNKDMLPGEQKSRLEQKWSTRRLLVLEEVGMISPALYNMLLYRAFHGRAANFEVPEAQYDKLQGAFGRVPLVLHLGDFLTTSPWLLPTGMFQQSTKWRPGSSCRRRCALSS